MKKNRMIRKAANSFVGRVLRRLLGEEKGQAMMEYIVIGLLIAAACVIGVAFFGHGITGMFGVLSAAMFGHPDDAAEDQSSLQASRSSRYSKAQEHNTGTHDGSPIGDRTW